MRIFDAYEDETAQIECGELLHFGNCRISRLDKQNNNIFFISFKPLLYLVATSQNALLFINMYKFDLFYNSDLNSITCEGFDMVYSDLCWDKARHINQNSGRNRIPSKMKQNSNRIAPE